MYVSLDCDNRIVASSEDKNALVNPISFNPDFSFNYALQNNYIVKDPGCITKETVIYSPKVDYKHNINKCKEYLASTDYVVIKLAEEKLGSTQLSGEVKNRYNAIINERNAVRKRMNEYEDNLGNENW